MTGTEHGVVVVTGSGRGLGRTIAGAVAATGAHVVVAEADPARAAEGVRHLKEQGASVTRVDTDVSDPDSAAALAERVRALRAEHGPLRGLVNNAARADGVGGRYFDEIGVEEWDGLMDVNLRGTWLVTRALYPLLAEEGRGAVVNLASDAALYGSPRLAHYVASKGAVIALTRAMARDAGRHGITVNAVAPGLTEVEATQGVPEERYELYRTHRALERDQTPEDVSGAVVFLLSGAASYVTGQTLAVDGGFVMN
ncbi:SDR family oxidoreductase [Nocardiopsis sp. HNM0947]|uniref:SDR family oxidoreductase n=1 Tax=Nocardiopsis coralli TaxID=2772213 RepID=A0ABR9P256_9ACTN|nr:SDR family oxidoreductase [Nocardiopsis coralli]MBE2997926.1 SDR family oxidoreductase [Nocardiopsis coralli]